MLFLAGQYLDFLLKDGRRRSFSMANAPHENDLIELHIRRIEGGYFTNFVFSELQEGALLRIEGPHGCFLLDEASQKPLIMVAGGTGFAPIKSLIEHMIHMKDDRPIALFWGARDAQDLYMADLVAQWMDTRPNFEYTPVLSRLNDTDNWRGVRGRVHEAVVAVHPDLSRHDVYVCGPPAMVKASRAAFLRCGLAEDSLHSDAFEFANNQRGEQPA